MSVGEVGRWWIETEQHEGASLKPDRLETETKGVVSSLIQKRLSIKIVLLASSTTLCVLDDIGLPWW